MPALRIACLHTMSSNIAVFEAALRNLGAPDVSLSHEVRHDLLVAAQHAGGITEPIARRAVEALAQLGEAADAVLLTCSTLGPAVERAVATLRVPVVRVDATLARRAVAVGGTVVVLCAAETTVAPTRALFESAARAAGGRAAIRLHLVPNAWHAFQAGNLERYFELIARAADAALAGGATCVALAQASMAPAVLRTADPARVLASPAEALTAAIVAARARYSMSVGNDGSR